MRHTELIQAFQEHNLDIADEAVIGFKNRYSCMGPGNMATWESIEDKITNVKVYLWNEMGDYPICPTINTYTVQDAVASVIGGSHG
jgi:hypothetical protein